MIFILYVLFHFVLLSSLLLFLYSGAHVVRESRDPMERWIRAGMMICGGLVALAAQVAGLTVADVTVNALSNASPLALTASATVPAAGGTAVGWYLIRVFPRSQDIGKRVTIFVATIAVIEFILIYAQEIREKGLGMGPAVIPNVAFVVGVILYIGLTYNKNPGVGGGQGAGDGGVQGAGGSGDRFIY